MKKKVEKKLTRQEIKKQIVDFVSENENDSKKLKSMETKLINADNKFAVITFASEVDALQNYNMKTLCAYLKAYIDKFDGNKSTILEIGEMVPSVMPYIEDYFIEYANKQMVKTQKGEVANPHIALKYVAFITENYGELLSDRQYKTAIATLSKDPNFDKDVINNLIEKRENPKEYERRLVRAKVLENLQTLEKNREEQKQQALEFERISSGDFDDVSIYNFCDLVEKHSYGLIKMERRTLNCLARSQYNSLKALLQATEEDLTQIRNIGCNTIQNVKDCLAVFGLTLAGETISTETANKIN